MRLDEFNRTVDEIAVFAGMSRDQVLALDGETFRTLLDCAKARRSAS